MLRDFILDELKKGKTYKEIGKIIGVSYQTIQSYVNHDTYPTVKKLMKLAEHYNLSIDYILGYTDKKRPLFPKTRKKRQ